MAAHAQSKIDEGAPLAETRYFNRAVKKAFFAGQAGGRPVIAPDNDTAEAYLADQRSRFAKQTIKCSKHYKQRTTERVGDPAWRAIIGELQKLQPLMSRKKIALTLGARYRADPNYICQSLQALGADADLPDPKLKAWADKQFIPPKTSPAIRALQKLQPPAAAGLGAGSLLKEMCEKHCIIQTTLADAIGVGQSTLSDWFGKIRVITGPNMVAIKQTGFFSDAEYSRLELARWPQLDPNQPADAHSLLTAYYERIGLTQTMLEAKIGRQVSWQRNQSGIDPCYFASLRDELRLSPAETKRLAQANWPQLAPDHWLMKMLPYEAGQSFDMAKAKKMLTQEKKAFGASLRAQHQKSELTLSEVAAPLHITINAISSWETGKNIMSLSSLDAYLQAVDAPPERSNAIARAMRGVTNRAKRVDVVVWQNHWPQPLTFLPK